MKYEKQLRPFLTGLGVMVGVGFFGGMVAGLYAPVLGWVVPFISFNVAQVLVAGGSVLAMEYILRKV